MTSRPEYHIGVRPAILPSVFAALVAMVFFTYSAFGQINGTPSSVTSPGFGGRAINGPPSSVTSLGPRGYSSNSHVSFSTTVPNLRHDRNGHDGQHGRRDHYGEYIPPLYYAVPVPYATDQAATDDVDPDDDPNYQGGPTIFDRRGLGERSYVPPVRDVPMPHAGQNGEESLSDPAPAEEPTVLVFKDGHQLEVGNYAIVDSTLYDLTPGHSRKIALADLDLDATRKQNDDRGVVFQLPPSGQAN